MDKFTVLSDTDGTVDVTASVAAYANALAKWVSINQADPNTVLNAIDEVFDGQDANKRLTIPTLISYTQGILKPAQEQFTSTDDIIRALVKSSPRFDSTKGKGGGTMRLYREGETPVAAPAKKTANKAA